MQATDPIWIAGHTGLIGSALVRCLHQRGFSNLLLSTRSELDLTSGPEVDRWVAAHHPRYVVLAAGKVGGIVENQEHPYDLIEANLEIQRNVLKAAARADVAKLVLLGSSCMYPRECSQPMPETALFTGPPEPTSLSYAVSKLAGVQMCLAYNQQHGRKRFIPVIPNSVFGPNDNFDLQSGHVLAALIRRIDEAHRAGDRAVTLWGTGAPRREFVYADDVADACIDLLSRDTDALELPLNVGTGVDFTIRELAEIIARVIGHRGSFEWDTTKPDGAPRKLLDSRRISAFGWKPKVDLEEGIKRTYDWYRNHVSSPEDRPVSTTASTRAGGQASIDLREKAQWVWRETLAIHRRAPETRLASSLSSIEIFVALYYGGILRFDPKDPRAEDRDRCIISKGHGSICMYPILADLGFFTKGELERVCKAGSFLGGIPDPVIPGYETVNGSLGHGLGVAAGMALGLKRKKSDRSVFVVVGDGELHEGSNWEAMMFASHHGLDNLHLIVDDNHISMLGYTDEIVTHGSLSARLTAFGWDCRQTDGHDPNGVCRSLAEMKALHARRPKALVARTLKGQGVPGLENTPLCHVMNPTPEVIDILLGKKK